MDGRMYRFSLYSTGLCPLRFPPGPLPCLHNSDQYKKREQGKGADDHLLPLGDWSFLVSPHKIKRKWVISKRKAIEHHQWGRKTFLSTIQ